MMILPSYIPDIADPQLSWKTFSEHAIKPGARWQRWLLDPGSLTQQLIKKSRNQFKVQVLAEHWSTLNSTALASHFGPVSKQHRFWSRKVVLLGQGQPWVMAHTLVPEHSLFSPLRQVLELKTKPLGEYLFSHPDLVRAEMRITPFAEDCWGRRSLFYLFGKPVMVAEFFLPQLVQD